VTDSERPTTARTDRGIGTDFVQSLERGLAVIRAFDAEHPELTLSDVARAAGLTRSGYMVRAAIGGEKQGARKRSRGARAS